MRLVATVEDPHVIREILARLALPAEAPGPDPPQSPPAPAASLFADVLA